MAATSYLIVLIGVFYRKTDLYVIRISRLYSNTNTHKSSPDEIPICYHNARPCIYCLQMLKLFGIRRVYYSTEMTSNQFTYDVENVSSMISSHISFAFRLSIITIRQSSSKKQSRNITQERNKRRKRK